MNIDNLKREIGDFKESYADFFQYFKENYPRGSGGLYERAIESLENMDLQVEERAVLKELIESSTCMALNIGPYQPQEYRNKLQLSGHVIEKSNQFEKILYAIYTVQRLSAQVYLLDKELKNFSTMKLASTESLRGEFRLLQMKVKDGVRIFIQYPGNIRDLGKKVQEGIKRTLGD